MTSSPERNPESIGTVLGNRSTRPASAPSQPLGTSDPAGRSLWQSLIASAGVRYERCRFENFDCKSPEQTSARDAVSGFASAAKQHAADGHGLLLYGPVGTGKDHLMFAAIREACRAGLRVEWRNGLDWFGTLRDRIGKDVDEEQTIRELVNCEVLALSDPLPPHGDLSSYQGQMLLRVIDRRYRRMKSTWVTMNVRDRAEATERMGAAVVDRLCDGALAVFCNWPSHRKVLP